MVSFEQTFILLPGAVGKIIYFLVLLAQYKENVNKEIMVFDIECL